MMADRMILGENAVYSTDSKKTGLNNNVIVCGGTGCGKTMSVTEPRLLETNNSSLIVTVTKRRIVDKYRPVFEARGYDVEELNFADPSLSTVSYDPLRYVRNNTDITYLATSIVQTGKPRGNLHGDPYWDNSSTSLLSAEIGLVLMRKKHASFNDVLELHGKLQTFMKDNGTMGTSLDEQFESLKEDAPDCFAVSCWNSFCHLPEKTMECVYGTLNTIIDKIFSPEVRRLIGMRGKVNFKKLAAKKTVLFLVTSPVNPGLNSYVNTFYGNAFKELFEYAESLPERKLPIPVSVICDDFATGGRILNFPEYISIFREMGISVTLLIQSESQLAGMYGEYDAATIINNCDTYLYMGGMDLDTASSVSRRLNKPMEDVLYMPVGREFIFRRGMRPVATSRYDIVNDDRYRKISGMDTGKGAAHER